MIIKNQAELATSRRRGYVLDIVEAGIARVLPAPVMAAALAYAPADKTLSVGGRAYSFLGGRLFAAGGGKAAGLMALALEEIVGPENISGGSVNCKDGGYATEKIAVIKAGHPIPDEAGLTGTRRMLALPERHRIGAGDLVVCLISGGGSALMPCPVPGVGLADKQAVTARLLASGADINEINIVRKHLSRTKGGGLGRHFAPAAVVSPILSDVIGNNLETIASGPTYPDQSTFVDAGAVLDKYNLRGDIPPAVADYLGRGERGEAPETPKTLDNCHNHIIGDNRLALEAMAARARELGYRPVIVSDCQEGDAGELARMRAEEIIGGKYAAYDVIIIGGEATIKLPPKPGKGGRNQHFAAATLAAFEDYPGEWALAAVGSDGSDFLPDVAGAIVDGSTLTVLEKKGLDIGGYLRRCDSFTLFKEAGNSLVVTGATGTNVGDVMVYILG